MTRNTLILSIACAVVLLFIGCSDTPRSPVVAPEEGLSGSVRDVEKDPALDTDLHGLLMAVSDGRGLEFFRLPAATHLDRIPQDPQNPLTPQKVHLGKLLYHETALAVNNDAPEGRETYSCASCHHVQGGFMANLPQGIGEGGSGFGRNGEGRVLLSGYEAPDIQPIRTPTALNSAYQELMLWNGQFGGVGENLGTEHLWEAGTPLESNHLGYHGLETQVHAGLGVHRMLDIAASTAADLEKYRSLFAEAFPGEAEPVNRLNCALAVAAYERTLLANQAPYQRWLKGNRNMMTSQEMRGAILFFGKAGCVECHTGPALNSMTFHALGMNDLDGAWDPARVNLEPFGGTVPDPVRQGRGGFTGRPEDAYAFKTPQLYNLTDSPFLGHGSSFASVREVVQYKNAAVPENPLVPPSRLTPSFLPLGLTEDEITDLTAFIETALHDPRLSRYVPRKLPSGNCFPVNDPQARIDLGCGD